MYGDIPYFSRWSSATVWPINSFVRHGKDLYKSEGTHNCAEPGNATQSRFYVSELFNNVHFELSSVFVFGYPK